jgi:hypothetical protein
MKCLLALALSVTATGCLSMSPRLHAEQPTPPCIIDPNVVGTWTDARMTQVGPAWVKLSLRRDCTSHFRAQLLWARITEQSRYGTSDGVIVFERASGQTDWRYEIKDGQLHLQEFPGEMHAYNRSR